MARKNKNRIKVLFILSGLCCLLFSQMITLSATSISIKEEEDSEYNSDIYETSEEQEESIDQYVVEYDQAFDIPQDDGLDEEEQTQTVQYETDELDQTAYVENLTLLLDEDTDMEHVEEILYEISSDFDLIVIEEIDLIHIQSKDLINQDEVVLNSELNSVIEEYGVLIPIEQEGIALADTEFDKSEVYLENFDDDNLDIEILEALSWHIDEVTNNKESLKFSTGSGIEIALIDSGVDYLHPLLVDKIAMSDARSYIPDDSSIRDTNGHGTMVAGVMTQIAPDARITPYRVISESSGESIWTIEAIVQAVNDGKQVINMSLGTYKNASDENESLTVKAFERAINYAIGNDTILVSSAGNLGLDLDINYQEESIRHLPGSMEGVVSVSSVSRDRNFASYNNYGSNVQFSAPGGDVILYEGLVDLGEWIYTSYPLQLDNGLSALGVPQGYMFSVGTSLSAPAVSAGIAVFITYYYDMTGELPNQDIILSFFRENALDLGAAGYDRYFGYGLIDIYNTLWNIEDCIPPTGSFIGDTVEINTEILAEDIVTDVSDNRDSLEDIDIYFKEDYIFSELGTQNIGIILKDLSGNMTILEGAISTIDTTPPTAQARQATIYQNDELRADELVYDVRDNAGVEGVSIELIEPFSTANTGIYSVNVRLQDQSGNNAVVKSEVEILSALSESESCTKEIESESDAEESDTSVMEGKESRKATLSSNNKGSTSGRKTTPRTGDDSDGSGLLGIFILSIVIIVVGNKKTHTHL